MVAMGTKGCFHQPLALNEMVTPHAGLFPHLLRLTPQPPVLVLESDNLAFELGKREAQCIAVVHSKMLFDLA